MPNNILIATSMPRQLIGCSVCHLGLCRYDTNGRDKNEIVFLILRTKSGGKKKVRDQSENCVKM